LCKGTAEEKARAMFEIKDANTDGELECQIVAQLFTEAGELVSNNVKDLVVGPAEQGLLSEQSLAPYLSRIQENITDAAANLTKKVFEKGDAGKKDINKKQWLEAFEDKDLAKVLSSDGLRNYLYTTSNSKAKVEHNMGGFIGRMTVKSQTSGDATAETSQAN
jgi:Ca2+-binding EF-hand superfamily protein